MNRVTVNSTENIKVDREDHFLRPGFLHIIMCFPMVESLKFR